MGGGLMQLVAMGAQDVFLTGNPQITFFKVMYKRHTNFSKECIEQEFNGNASFGGNATCTLARNGDLVQEIYVKMSYKLDARGWTSSGSSHVNKRDVNELIEHVEVEIGGQKIDKHYSQWLDIYNELFETNHDYSKLLRFPPTTIVKAAATAAGVTATSGQDTDSGQMYIPLRFWFNRNAGLALPLIALQYHEVKINVKFLPMVVASTYVKDLKSSLMVNYIYLDTDERRRFAQVSHEYLIEQVQHTGSEELKAQTKLDLNFNHPVKALLWTSKTKHVKKAKLQLNGHDRFSEQEGEYFHLLQPYECGLGHTHSLIQSTRKWGPVSVSADEHSVGMYSFCLKPGEHQPSGSCNFSRIDNAKLHLTNSVGTSPKIWVFALNYNVLRIMSGMGGLTYSN